MNRYRPNECIINLGYAQWSVGPGPWHGSGWNFWGWNICLWVYSPYHMISSLPRTPLAGWGYILLSSCSLFMLDNLFRCYFLLMHRNEIFVEFRRKASLSAVQCPGLSPQSLVERRLQLFLIVTVCEKLALVYLGPSCDQIGKVCLLAITGSALLDDLGGPWLLV